MKISEAEAKLLVVCDACGSYCRKKERKYEVCLRERNSPQVAWTKQDLCDECYSRLIQYVGFEDQEVKNE